MVDSTEQILEFEKALKSVVSMVALSAAKLEM